MVCMLAYATLVNSPLSSGKLLLIFCADGFGFVGFVDDCCTMLSPAIAALSRGLTLKTYDPGLRLTFDFVPMSTTDSVSEPGNDILFLLSPKSMTALINEHKQKCISSYTSSRG